MLPDVDVKHTEYGEGLSRPVQIQPPGCCAAGGKFKLPIRDVFPSSKHPSQGDRVAALCSQSQL